MSQLLEIKGKINRFYLYFEESDQIYVRTYYSSDDNLTEYNLKEQYEDNKQAILDECSNSIGEINVDNGWLANISVHYAYQGEGIGSNLVRLAIKYLDLLYVPCVQIHGSYEYSLTPEGERLVASCIRKGIIDPTMCYFSREDPSLLDDDVNFSDDPRYDSHIIRDTLPSPIDTDYNQDPFDNYNEDEPMSEVSYITDDESIEQLSPQLITFREANENARARNGFFMSIDLPTTPITVNDSLSTIPTQADETNLKETVNTDVEDKLNSEYFSMKKLS